MLFGQIGFHCPLDGQVQAGFDCVENMVVYEEGKTEISIRCPKCGTLVHITSQVSIIPPQIVQQLAQELSVSMKDGKLDFSDLMNQVAGFAGELSLKSEGDASNGSHNNLEDMVDRELTPSEGNHVEYFARELEKIESVDDFLMRVNEETI